jgi:hypothetical protein
VVPIRHIDTPPPPQRDNGILVARLVWGILAAFVLVVAILSFLHYDAPAFTSTGSSSVPGQADQNAAYKDNLATWTRQYGTGLDQFATLNANPRLSDANWKMNIVLAIYLIQGVDKEVAAYSPPPKFAAFHAKLQTAARHFDNATNLYMKGVDSASPSIVLQAASEMEAGAQITKELVPEFNALNP